MILKLSVLTLFILTFSGCLKTRSDVKEIETKQVLHKQMVDLQKTNADSGSRLSEIEEQLRYANGRIEAAEAKANRNASENEKNARQQNELVQEMNKKMMIYQDALSKLEVQTQQNAAEIANLKSELANRGSKESSKSSKDTKKDNFAVAQDLFKQKDWQNAIIEYQKYRDKNPKGKHMAEATYKIGVCFQELSLKDDAKTFYQEVSTSFPNSEEAKKAKARLKGLK